MVLLDCPWCDVSRGVTRDELGRDALVCPECLTSVDLAPARAAADLEPLAGLPLAA